MKLHFPGEGEFQDFGRRVAGRKHGAHPDIGVKDGPDHVWTPVSTFLAVRSASSIASPISWLSAPAIFPQTF